MVKQWLASWGGGRGWLSALSVLVIAAVLVVLDLAVGSVHHYWSTHTFTSSVLSGLLVLLLTVLIVDRVTRRRRLRDQSRAIAAQAGAIMAEAVKAADACRGASLTADELEAAADELRTYTMMLLISAPLLIDATVSRTFLETAQRLAVQLSRAVRSADDEQARGARASLDGEVQRLRDAAAPLLSVLNRDERAAVSSEAGE